MTLNEIIKIQSVIDNRSIASDTLKSLKKRKALIKKILQPKLQMKKLKLINNQMINKKKTNLQMRKLNYLLKKR